MKKSITLLLGLFALAATTLSCQKNEAINGANQMDSEGKKVTITACIPEGMTKVSFTPSGDILELNWDQDNDKLTINGEEFRITAIDGKKATFTGNEPSGDSYTIVLNQIGTASLNTQEQSEDGNADHVKYSVALSDVDSYQDIEFSETWAGNHHGSIELSSALRILAQLPSGVAQKVTGVNIKALDAKGEPANVFAGGNSIAVNLKEAPASGDKVNIYATLPAGTVSIPVGTQFFVKFVTPGAAQDYYTRYHEFTSASSFDPGKVNTLTLQCKNTASYAGKDDDGTEQKPYLIADKYQLLAISLSTTKQYYKLVDDIDMTGVTWTSLNADGTNVIDLDGNSKKISNMRSPLFADLNGNVHDLTLYNSVVSSAETVGILANTCNTAASTVSRVTVTGDESPRVSSLTNTATSERKYGGGLVGEVSTLSTFDYCHVINTTIQETTSDCTYTGGAFGYIHHDSSNTGKFRYNTVETCVIKSSSYVGGLVGNFSRGNVHHNKVGYDSDGNKKKCTITGINDDSTGDYKGGLIGYHRYGYVQSNEVYSDVKGANYVGGLIGYAWQGMENNSTAGDVTSSGQYTGGLVGYSKAGTITGCSSSSAVSTSYTTSAYAWAGGLVGRADGGTISNCSATGNINSSNNKAGLAGLIAHIAGNVTIESCYATGNVAKGDGNYTIRGGLIGQVASGTVSISNSYATGEIEAQRWSGGLIGDVATDNLTVTNCYTSSVLTISTPNQAGVFIGKANNKTISYSGIIAWNTSELANFIYLANVTAAPDGNYFGKEGTISSHAKDLGWKEEVWDFDQDAPRLKWTLE